MPRRGNTRGRRAVDSAAHRAQARRLQRMTDEEIEALPQKEFDRLTDGLSVDETPDAVLKRILGEEVKNQAEEFNDKVIAAGGPNLIKDGFSIDQIREIEGSLSEEEKSSSGKMVDAAARFGRAEEFREIMLSQGFDLAGMGYDLREVAAIRDGIEATDRASGGEFIDKATEYFESKRVAETGAADPSPRSGPKEASSGGGIADWFSPKAWYDWMYEDPTKDSEAQSRRLDFRPASPSPSPAAPSPSNSPTPSVSSSPGAYAEPKWLCDLFGGCGLAYVRNYNQTTDTTTYNITGSAGNSSQIVVSGSMPFPATELEARNNPVLWSNITGAFVDCVIPSVSPSPSTTPSFSPTATPSVTSDPTSSVTPSPSPFAVDGWAYNLWRDCGIDPSNVTRTHEVRSVNGTDTEITTFTRTNPDLSIVRLEVTGSEPFPATEAEFRDESGSYASEWAAMRTWMGTCMAASNSPSPTPSVSASPSTTTSTSPSSTPNVTSTPSSIPSVSASPSTTISAAPSTSPSSTPNVTSTPSSIPSVSASPSPGWYVPGLPDWFNEGLNNCINATAEVFGAATPSDTSDDTVRLNITRSDGSGNSSMVDVGDIDDIPGSRSNATGLSWLDKAQEADPACFPAALASVSPFPSPSGSAFPSPSGNTTIAGRSSGSGPEFPVVEASTGGGAGLLVAAAAAYAAWRWRRAATRETEVRQGIQGSRLDGSVSRGAELA